MQKMWMQTHITQLLEELELGTNYRQDSFVLVPDMCVCVRVCLQNLWDQLLFHHRMWSESGEPVAGTLLIFE